MMVLFTNMHVCMYGSDTTQMYGVTPPTVEEYLQSANTRRYASDM